MTDLKTMISVVDNHLGKDKSKKLLEEIEDEVMSAILESKKELSDSDISVAKNNIFNKFKNEIMTAYSFIKK